jgi:pyruvate/2-oxoglutarate dehydrogenase complex dihydrolipoamide dehydrogenase (E3) component
MEKFDVVIIGSGPGGYVAAIRAGQLGLKTAIVEKDKELGGACLNIGCIPSKALLTSSDHFMWAQKEAVKHGINIENATVDLNKMMQRKDKVVKTMNSGVRALMKTNKVATFEGWGTIAAPGKVSVKGSDGNTHELETKNIIIATGRAVANEELDGMVKIIAEAKTDRILGGHVLQHAASELIAEIVSVIEFGGSSEDLARTTHAHPTLSEAVKEAAMNVEKRALHILNR